MIKYIAIFIVLTGISLQSQYLKVVPYDGGFGFYVDRAEYTLPESDNISYRVYDQNNICIGGATGNYTMFFEPIYFTGKHGYYTIVLYIIRDKYIINERVEAK